jgi:hypothetical protein
MMSLSLRQIKHTSTYLAVSTNRIFTTGQRKIHSSSVNGLPLHSSHVTLQCGVANFGVICHYFLTPKIGVQLTVTSPCYIQILRTSWHRNWVVMELSSRTCGSSKMVQLPIRREHPWQVFQEMLPEHVISLRGELPWPARSPDLSASDYFLWGVPQNKSVHLLDHEVSMTSRSQFDANLSDTRKHGQARIGKAASKVGGVCMHCVCAINKEPMICEI